MNSYYYIGHFSKFIRPGARRIISSSTLDPLLTTAFLNKDGTGIRELLAHRNSVICHQSLAEARLPVGGIWDNGVEGTIIDNPEYRECMDLRRQLQNGEIQAGTSKTVGELVVSWIHSKDRSFLDANAQSVIAKVDFKGFYHF